MPNDTVHGTSEHGGHICHSRYGWYIRGGNLIPMEKVSVRRAAIEALRGGHIILGVQSGRVFDRTVRHLGIDADFGEPTGTTAWDAAEIFWRGASGQVELVRHERCWEAGFPDGAGDPATIHVDRQAGLAHRPGECPHA